MAATRRTVLSSALVAVLAGCTGDRPSVTAPAAAGDPTARTPLPPETPLPPGGTALPPSDRSPFIGLPVDLAAPVLAVKIDNVPQGHPHTGTTAADLVYVQPVEGGLTRLLAVFHSRLPPVVGPVRSVRQTDLQLLSCLGAPALAFSGEAPELRPALVAAPIVDVSQPAAPAAYYRDPLRRAPHNLYVRADALRAGSPPRDIGFRFGPVASGGRPMERLTVPYPSTGIDVEWVPAEQRWVFGVDGAPLVATEGGRPGAATVVLQRVLVQNTAIVDVTGAPSPFAESVGAGSAVLLRDGRTFDAAWSRPSPDAPTSFTHPGGAPLTFAHGPVWVLLVPA